MLKTVHIIERKGTDAGAFLDQLRAAKAEGRLLIDVVRGAEDAKVITLVEPGPGVVHQTVRQAKSARRHGRAAGITGGIAMAYSANSRVRTDKVSSKRLISSRLDGFLTKLINLSSLEPTA